jgi:hypothetical protein
MLSAVAGSIPVRCLHLGLENECQPEHWANGSQPVLFVCVPEPVSAASRGSCSTFGNMKRRVIIGLGVLAIIVATPLLATWLEEWRLCSRDRFVADIGCPIPQDSEIVTTRVHNWSLVDAANYSWSIRSPVSLSKWVQSIGKWEYGRTYRVYKVLANGREETSYISLAADEHSAMVETFRP